MRSIPLLCLAATLGSCAMGPQQPMMRSPSGQRSLESMITGRVAGPAVNCLPSYRANDMSIIDGQTLGFRSGTNTAYIMHLSTGCELLEHGSYAMLTRQYGGLGLCTGDIAQVFDTLSHSTNGSCVIREIVPWSRPRS